MRRLTTVAVLFVVVLAACDHDEDGAPPAQATFNAGVATVDITPPVGAPLGGFGGPERRLIPPDFNPFDYHTLFKPSQGIIDPLYAKALVLSDGRTTAAIVSVDAIAMSGELADRIHQKAQAMGSTLHKEDVLMLASHTHSGPGAVTGLHFWEVIAADFMSRPIRDGLVEKCARALVEAERSVQPARLGIAAAPLPGVTVNRRAALSPYLTPEMVDDELAVIRVDREDGSPLAVVWNFAVHGTAYGAGNLKYSADIMGAVSAYVEQRLGATALFANGAEGDIRPARGGAAGIQELAPVIGAKVLEIRASIEPVSAVRLQSVSEVVPFGDAVLDLARALPFVYPEFDFTPYLSMFSVPLKMDARWFENAFRFQAVRIDDAVLVSVPGEPLHQVGLQIKEDGRRLGFDRVLVCGLANGHMAYVPTEAEYAVGGYESLVTFFGPGTGGRVRSACDRVMRLLTP